MIVKGWKPRNFNPRSLAGATCAAFTIILAGTFQSTLPCGSDFFLPSLLLLRGISIHAPLRERLVKVTGLLFYISISIHAPLRERPFHTVIRNQPYIHFNPRSLAGATICGNKMLPAVIISIHAPLRERRTPLLTPIIWFRYFNPRSLAGATAPSQDACSQDKISIHAPLRERQLRF